VPSVIACFAVWRATPAFACPDCAVGRAARAELWSESFVYNLTVLLVPFAFIVAASILAERIGRPEADRNQRGTP
jgi:hypothetical protein